MAIVTPDFAAISRVGAALLLSVLVIRITYSTIYNLFFHPLRDIPGPILRRASNLPYLYCLNRGTQPFDVLALHNKYGPIVRLRPDELSFLPAGGKAFNDIYGHRVGTIAGVAEMPKADMFYRSKGIPPSIISEDRDNHAMLRRQLAHGFSERAMREQEGIIGGYVDLMMRQLRERAGEGKDGKRKPPVDMKSWYNWATFDIIGDLAFGEPFGCLENAKYDAWVYAIARAVKMGAIFTTLKLLRLADVIIPLRIWMLKGKGNHLDLTRLKLERRMKLDSDRYDLIEGLLRKKDEWELDFQRLRANASILIIAGSETTATLLAGVTFLLLTNPDKMEKLVNEVRTAFESETEITLTSVAGKLPYMLACLNEALRRYPPVAIGLPRVTPEGGAIIDGKFVPEGTVVSCWQWASNHSTINFEDPFAYKPERWLDENKNSKDRLDAVQPFSVGPRNCIGKNLAIAEMRLILARILWNFDLELSGASRGWLDEQKVYTLWDKGVLDVYLTPVR